MSSMSSTSSSVEYLLGFFEGAMVR
jgi:hypothetical protein